MHWTVLLLRQFAVMFTNDSNIYISGSRINNSFVVRILIPKSSIISVVIWWTWTPSTVQFILSPIPLQLKVATPPNVTFTDCGPRVMAGSCVVLHSQAIELQYKRHSPVNPWHPKYPSTENETTNASDSNKELENHRQSILHCKLYSGFGVRGVRNASLR